MAKMRGGEMGSADMSTDMKRMQEMQDMMREWSQKMSNYATESKDPYAWCTYRTMMDDFEAHQKSMQRMMQAMKEMQSAGMESQMSQGHMRVAQAMMGEKMRM